MKVVLNTLQDFKEALSRSSVSKPLVRKRVMYDDDDEDKQDKNKGGHQKE